MKNLYTSTAWLYDMDNRDVYTDDIPFYIDYAKKQGGEVLELACGTGRVSIPIAEAGINVTGIDLSPEMLNVFQNKLNDKPELSGKVNLIHGNIAHFELKRKFPLIIIPFRAFLCLTDEQDIANSLACIYKHLTDDGLFIIDVFNTHKNLDNWCGEEKIQWENLDESSGNRIVKKAGQDKIDLVNRIMYCHSTYEVTTPDGKTEFFTEELKIKYYYNEQLRAVIEKAGMEIVEEYSWYDKSPPGGREIIFVCRRKM